MPPTADDRPLFALYGALRSGTTLLRLILRAHPQIRSEHENDCFLDHLKGEGTKLRLDAEGLEHDWIFREMGLRVPATRDGRAAFEDLLAQHRAGWRGPLLLVLHRGIGRLMDLRPETRVIHLLRDPRDVARSSIGMGWVGTPWHGAAHWIRTEEEWERNAARVPAVHQVRYEDLLRDPVAELTGVCRFMGLDYDPAMMDYVRTSSYSDIDPKMAEQWRRRMAPRDVGLVEHRVGGLLAARGYGPSGHPATAPTGAERLRLGFANRAGVWRTRTRRYGWVDPVVYGLAKRLGLEGLRRRAQLRLDARRKAFLK